MVEAVMIWNEPNNLCHWDAHLDFGWTKFAQMTRWAVAAIRGERPHLKCVLGGISPADPRFIMLMSDLEVLNDIDIVAVHGFPGGWCEWQICDWPKRLAAIKAVTSRPVWVTEVGMPSLPDEITQAQAISLTANILEGRTDRLHWYSLYDNKRDGDLCLPRTFKPAAGIVEQHYHYGLLRADGTPKRAFKVFKEHTPFLGLCQWFVFEDPRIHHAAQCMLELGVKCVRTGLSWADSVEPGADAWFDKQMRALDRFDVTVTFCFTPESSGIEPHHSSPPRRIDEFADFCARMVRRYA